MTKEEFYKLVAATGLDPRTLKRHGIEPRKEGRVLGENDVMLDADANRISLARMYEQEAESKLKAARALRGDSENDE